MLMLLLVMMTGLHLPQGIVSLLLNAHKSFCSEIVLKLLKNNPFLHAGLFSPEPKALVAWLVDDKVVSVGDKASVDEAATNSDK